MTEQELLEAFQEAFTNEDYEDRVDDLKEKHAEDVDDIDEVAFHAAVLAGNVEYVQDHMDEVDMDPDGEGCPYLDETDNQDIIDALFEGGASRDSDDYSDYRFAIDSNEWIIISFNEDFVKEVFAKLLTVCGLTEEMFLKNAQDDDSESLPDPKSNYTYDDVMSMLGIDLDDDGISFHDMAGESSVGIQDFLEELGWDCQFEGSAWKLDTNGVFFIE